MLKCEVGKEIGCEFEMEGTILDFANDICNIAQGVHHRLKQTSPFEAIMFRSLLIQAMNQPETWVPVEMRDEE